MKEHNYSACMFLCNNGMFYLFNSVLARKDIIKNYFNFSYIQK